MYEGHFFEVVEEICGKDSRYDPEAYAFLRNALDFTNKLLNKPTEGAGRHVTGQELLHGIKNFAIQEFGPMALTVLNTWGIRKTEDFGEIVFNLVETGKLGRTEQDKKEDFAGGYDFYEAFAKPFIPAPQPDSLPAARRQAAGKKDESPAQKESSSCK